MLGELERRWRERGAPVDELLQRGLTSEEVWLSVLPVHAPHPDVVTWYGWHNGSRWTPEPILAPTGRLLTQLEEALSLRQIFLDLRIEMIEEGLLDDPDDSYKRMWLPVATTRNADGHTIAVDVATGAVYRYDNGPGASSTYPKRTMFIADDLASLVGIWCEELDRGTYVWNAQTYEWEYDRTSQPRDLFERNIVH
jgi:hypothetical protein